MSRMIEKLEDIQNNDILSFENSIQSKNPTLLLEARKESLEPLHKIGLDHSLNTEMKKLHEQKALNFFKKQMGSAFSGYQIKRLCNLYGLRMNRAVDFKGAVDYSEVGDKIKTFCDKNNITPNYNKFYILAPRESFNHDSGYNGGFSLFYKEGNHNYENVLEQDRLIEVYSKDKGTIEHRIFHTLFCKSKKKTFSDDDEISTSVITFICFGVYILALISGFFFMPLCVGLCAVASILTIINGLFTKDEFNRWNQND